MAGKLGAPTGTENPGEGNDDSSPVGENSPSSGLENPDAANSGLEALGTEAEQQAVFAEAGVFRRFTFHARCRRGIAAGCLRAD